MAGDSFSVINRETLRKPRQSRIRPRPAHLCAVSLNGCCKHRFLGGSVYPSPPSVILFLTDQLSHQAQNKPSCHPSMGPLHQEPMEHSFQPFEGAEIYPFYRKEDWGTRRACQLSCVAFLNPLHGEVLNQIQSTAWRIRAISTKPRKGKMILPGDRQCKVNNSIPILLALLNRIWSRAPWFSTRAGSN